MQLSEGERLADLAALEAAMGHRVDVTGARPATADEVQVLTRLVDLTTALAEPCQLEMERDGTIRRAWIGSRRVSPRKYLARVLEARRAGRHPGAQRAARGREPGRRARPLAGQTPRAAGPPSAGAAPDPEPDPEPETEPDPEPRAASAGGGGACPRPMPAPVASLGAIRAAVEPLLGELARDVTERVVRALAAREAGVRASVETTGISSRLDEEVGTWRDNEAGSACSDPIGMEDDSESTWSMREAERIVSLLRRSGKLDSSSGRSGGSSGSGKKRRSKKRSTGTGGS